MGVHEVVSVHIQQRIRWCSHEHAQSHDKVCDYCKSFPPHKLPTTSLLHSMLTIMKSTKVQTLSANILGVDALKTHAHTYTLNEHVTEGIRKRHKTETSIYGYIWAKRTRS